MQAQLAINNFLELPMDTEIKCEVPSQLPSFAINANTALGKAYENNPDIIALEANLVQVRRDVKAAKRNRYSADFRATVGLNQNQDKLANAYKELQDQETVSFTVSIPLLDWGEGRRSINRAQVNQMMQEESARKRKDAIAIEIMNMVSDFNIRYKQVAASEKANSIAQEAYDAVQQQFMLGKSSVLEVNSSYTSMQSAQNNYISSLNRFWVQLYSLRRICLYDFEQGQDISADFDALLDVDYK
ncbi:MAG: TolC family protein [Mangrovibacterium sp.]